MTTADLEQSAIWRDVRGIPGVIEGVRERFAQPDAELLAAFDAGRTARRIVVTGNGSAFYAALAMEAASRVSARGDVVAVPAGVLVAGGFRWRDGDLPFIVSSSGELRDVVSLVTGGDFPAARIVMTATPGSTLAAAATARITVDVPDQSAVTHTQAYVANVLTGTLFVQAVASDAPGVDAATLADRMTEAIDDAPSRARSAAERVGDRDSGIAVAGGAGWPTALETGLLFKEIAGLAVEGLETREAATTGMYALSPKSVVFSHALEGDADAHEAEQICAATGAAVVRLRHPAPCSPLELPVLGFAAAAALAVEVGLRRGRDVDRPEWTSAYYRTARTQSH